MFNWLSRGNEIDNLDNLKYEEIKTKAPRDIIVKLSEADCERLSILCGKAACTVSEIFEAFVGDLVDGTHSSSFGGKLAKQWYEERGYCMLEMLNRESLLYHLLDNYYDPEDYIDILDEIDNVKNDIKTAEKNIAEADNEWKKTVYCIHDEDSNLCKEVPCYNSVEEYIAEEKKDLIRLKSTLAKLEKELGCMSEDWKPKTDPDMDKEIERIRTWVSDKYRLKKLKKVKSVDQSIG